MINISGLTKTTLLDFPGHVASTIFLSGCNFRCPFCHNSSLINGIDNTTIASEEVFNFLNKRSGIISGVCISGGEPTLYKELPAFIKKIRSFDLKVKLDTNGYNPDMLSFLISNDLLDMVSMDIKGSKDLYPKITGVEALDISRIEKSVEILKQSSIIVEFRTTIVDNFFTEENIHSIGEWLGDTKAYCLQSFENSASVLQPGLLSPSDATMNAYLNIAKKYNSSAFIRGQQN